MSQRANECVSSTDRIHHIHFYLTSHVCDLACFPACPYKALSTKSDHNGYVEAITAQNCFAYSFGIIRCLYNRTIPKRFSLQKKYI